jgi:hypothetical protein
LRYGSSFELALVAIPGVNSDRRRIGIGIDWSELDRSVLAVVLSDILSSKLPALAASCFAPSRCPGSGFCASTTRESRSVEWERGWCTGAVRELRIGGRLQIVSIVSDKTKAVNIHIISAITSVCWYIHRHLDLQGA